MKKILLMFCFGILINSSIWAQNTTVTGKVVSEDKSALPGVSVSVKGTTTGTITDVEGRFSISVPRDATLLFSFVGYLNQEIQVGNRSTIDVSLIPDVQALSEVVVTAVGIERNQKSLGYSVEKVDASKVQQVSEPDVLRGLQGKVPGVNIIGSSGVPGSATRLTIRGTRSFFGNNQPLFIVDGIPYDNSTNGANSGGNSQLSGGGAYSSRIADLDPNNIQSMTVLKGGAAAALYGIRAANGVVVITTKTGAGKSSKKGLEVTFSSSYSIENIANLPKYQNSYGTGTGFVYAASNGSWGAPFKGAVPYPTIDSIPIWPSVSAAFPELAGTKVPYQAYPNNVKDFFKTGRVFENSITVAGSTGKGNLTATLSKMNQDGYIPNSKFERTNLSLGGGTTLENGLTIGGNFAYTNSLQSGPAGGANNAIGNASAFGRTMFLGRNWDLQGQPFENPITHANIFFVSTGQSTNPYWSTKYDGFNANINRVLASINASYDIFNWLTASYKIGINTYSQRDLEWYRPGSRGGGGIGEITETNTTFTEIESNFLLSASRKLSDDLGLKVVVGHNVNQRTTQNQSFQGSGMIDFDILDLDNTNSVIPFGGTYQRRRLYGIFADATLSYRDYAFLTVTGRNDWSSTLPKSNRSFFYPAVNGSFVFTEAFGIQSKILNSGKIRASWAKVGNDAPPYSLFPTYQLNLGASSNLIGALPDNDFPFKGIPAATLSNTDYNPNLKPEFTRSVELGTELRLLDNRVGIDFTFYHTKTTEQIGFLSLPRASGFNFLLTNFGTMTNKGVEIGLDVTPISLNNGFRWNIYGTFTKNVNRVDELVSGLQEIEIQGLFGGSVVPVLRPGLPYGVIRGSVSARDENGNLLIDPSNGQLIRSSTPEIIGDPNPDFIIGLTNSFTWKGITLGAVFDYRHGGDLYSTTVQAMLGRGVTKDTEKREMNYVIPGVLGDPNTQKPLLDSDGKTIPNNIQVEMNDLYFGDTFAVNGADEWSVFDATTIRLREVSLGYELPKQLMQKTPFGSAKISFTGRNIWYKAPNFPKYTRFDPETSTFGSLNIQGFEYNTAPSVRRFGVNLRLTF
ncbi:SusC/RagA family TonB-linked outer membrane protein [Xanthocytophaga flava]|uniref:SusC/RagA family TonB-linked outer membrane protein n=1 Tax=Xanthocytophaga flava TaxID=3048013 RepID=UPI0028D55734|nr:SusC/RagA family TonB-linked outer membrane protein [Xanthocytophaga flavus]MDJ1468373.1 SusC/RagA family TonB-linked outer membrane protein [Xanthocytophaga flavus]